MNKNITLAAIALTIGTLTSACATQGVTEVDCDGQARQVTIHYGDSEIRVTPPVINLSRAEELRFRLRPDSKASDEVDYETVLVTIKGKSADANWIDESGTYDDTGGYLGICVPTDQPRDTYYYFVEVDQVGKIDPRADVQ